MEKTIRSSATSPRIGFWLLIGVLAISGVAMAVIVLLGLTESKAFGLVGFLFLADLYLVVSLAARHTWLRRTIWVGTVATFVVGVILVFLPEQSYYVESADPSVPYDELARTPYGMLSDTNFALHTLLGTLLVLGVLSLAYQWIKNDAVIRIIYVVMFTIAIISAVLWAIGFIVQDSGSLVPFQLGMSILALTAAAIVVIAAFVQRNAQSHARGSDELRTLVRQYVDEYLAERER